MSAEPAFTDLVTSPAGLRERYRNPVKVVAEKKLDHVPPWGRAMIEASRFVFLATADADGRATVSPKGGDDGFVTVLDPHRLAIPDYPGNNLLDSLHNILENPTIGLIFLIPGRGETLRVDGDACVTVDPEVLRRCQRDDRRTPKSAIGVQVRTVFFHCPASFQRAGLWEPASWRPDASQSIEDFVRGALPPGDRPDWAT